MQTTEEAAIAELDLAENDLGPLAWILEELRKAMEGSVKAMRRFAREAEAARGNDLVALDASQLRQARQQLHQATGALEMIGLEPPARVLRSMEAAVQSFVQKPDTCKEEAVGRIESASFALIEYLESVLAGKPVSAVGLFPQYRELQDLAGGTPVHPADLWSAQSRWVDPPLAGQAEPLGYAPAVRARLDQAVLRIVKSGDLAAAREIRDIALGLARAGNGKPPGLFWKICAAYFEAFTLGLLPADIYVKRVASRILMQYTTLARGEPAINERLLQDMLFYCAQAVPVQPGEAPALSAVRQTYGLARFQPVNYETRRFGRFDPALLVQARKRIAAATETWSALAGGDVNKLKSAADQFNLVSDSLLKLQPDSAELARALSQAMESTVRSGQPPSAPLAMEVATAVLYLQAAYDDLDPTDPQLAPRAARLAERLDRVRGGGESEALEAWMEELYRGVSDRQTMGSVVEELRGTLGEVEKSLDQYFREPQDKAPLSGVSSLLSQMRGVLSVLGLDQASHAVMRMRESIDRLITGDAAGQAAMFEKLGNSLGALGFLVDMLNYQRALAKKLFVYDEEQGELKLLMGRRSTPAQASVSLSEAMVPAAPAAVVPAAAPVAPALASPAVVQPPTVSPAVPAAAPVAPPAVAQSAPTAAPAPAVLDEEDQELRDIFLEEAREVVQNGLVSIEALNAAPGDLTEQTTLRRAFHTLKGSSRMVGLSEFGEAAWSLEQLLNAWLAEQKPVGPPLLQLSGEALLGLGRWVEDIATQSDAKWKALPFRKAADALRLQGRAVELELPGLDLAMPSAADEVAGGAEAVPVPAAVAEPAPAEEPLAISVEEVSADDLDFDVVQAFSDTRTPDFAPSVAPPEEAPLTLGVDAFDLSALGEPAAAAQPLPEEISQQPLEALPEPAIEASQAAGLLPELDFDLELPTQVQAAPMPPADEAPLPEASSEAPAEVPAEAVAEILAEVSDEVSVAEDDPAAPEPLDDSVKAIGELRIPIPLYNVYLNEADEWSRRLLTEATEWSLELHQPVPDSIVALAHSLAGSSATVGFGALSEMARTLEHALQHVQLQSVGKPEQARVFVDAAEDIRRLLHQFAAGFLKEPDEHVMQALRDVLAAEAVSLAPLGAEEAEQVLSDLLESEAAGEQAQEPVQYGQSAPADADTDAGVDVSPAAEIPAQAVAHAPVSEPARTVVDPDQKSKASTQIDDDIDVEDTIDPDLFPIFEEEAIELLPQLGGALRQWAARPENESARSEVLRALHTLKGSARLAGAMRLGEQAHRMESAIEHLDTHAPQPSQMEPLLTHFDAVQANFDGLRGLSAQVQAAEAELLQPEESVAAAVQAVPADPAAADAPQAPRTTVRLPSTQHLAPLRQASSQSVRVRSQLLDRLVNQAGEVLISRSRLESHVGQMRGAITDLTGNLDRLRQQLRDIELQAETQMQSRLAQSRESAGFDPLEFDRFTRVQELTRMMAESVNDVATVQRNLQRTLEGAEDDLIAQGRQARELQRDLLRTRMVEFEGISERLYAVVRQASKDAGKQVKLDITGGAIELDRGVLERMAPAFEHLLRNSVAHGIESAEARSAANKPAAGTITIGLHHEGNDVSVEFSDDGGGLDLERIRQKAEAQGLVAAGAGITDAEAAQLIFLPGFSTAAAVSELAGRGIGMDVVRAEVNALGGRIETSTQPGRGTQFKLVLPLTTAVTQVVMLRSGELSVGVPSSLVEIVRRVPMADIEAAYARGSFEYGGETLPFYWSGALLQSSAHSTEPPSRTRPVLILRSASQRLAMHVDEVLGNQEVVVKNLGPQLARLPGLAGMSMLASGAVVLIYNPVALATVYGEQAKELSQSEAQAAADDGVAALVPQPLPVVQRVPLVLVVDDSITVRRVTQRLLQREGYRVALAADGLQALERLQEELPSIVLSDIEMPRMDGFDLVRNIRGDSQMKSLPVVMITSRIAEKHREHAFALGANHYLGKPYSEEELLSLVRRYCTAETPEAPQA